MIMRVMDGTYIKYQENAGVLPAVEVTSQSTAHKLITFYRRDETNQISEIFS